MKLNSIDEEIITLLNLRMEISKEIGFLKKNNHLPTTDEKREEWLLMKSQLMVNDPILRESILAIFQLIMNSSKDVQTLSNSSSLPFQNIGIAGLGLMGGSFAKAVKIKNPKCSISLLKTAFDQEIPLDLIDFTFSSLEAMLPSIELLVVATPIETSIEIAKKLSNLENTPSLIVMDIMSVKSQLSPYINELQKSKIKWISTHPMTGKISNGYENSEARLFVNKPWFQLTKNDQISQLIQELGGILIPLKIEQHDSLAAVLSHFPSLLSSKLKEFIESINPLALKLGGPTLQGMLRAADDAPNLKKECQKYNQKEVFQLLKQFSHYLENIE